MGLHAGDTKIGTVRKWISEGKSLDAIQKLYRTKYNREIPNSYYYKAKVSLEGHSYNSSSSAPANRSVNPVSASADNQPINTESQGAIIEGKAYSPEIAEAPIQSEGSEIAKNYQENNSQPVTDSKPVITEGMTQEQINAQVLEVKNTNGSSPVPPGLEAQQSTFDLKMFASLPAIVEEGVFLLPQVQKMTDGYKVEQEDLDNITKYTTELIQKYDKGGISTKYAQELNFIGALAVPAMKGFGRKLAEMLSKIGDKAKGKKQEKPKAPELHKEPGVVEQKPKTPEALKNRAQEILRETEQEKRIREAQEYEESIKQANLTPTADNPNPKLEDLQN